MKRIIDYLAIRNGFLVALIVVLSGSALGQSRSSKDATRTTMPGAAEIQNMDMQPTGVWSRRVESINNNGHADSSSEPMTVKGVKDSSGKQAFQARVIVSPQGDGFQGQFLAIPAGKRLVIEHVSAIARCPEGLRMEINFFSYLDNNGDGVGDVADITFHRIALTDQGVFGGTAISSANHKMLVFADEQIGTSHFMVGVQARLNGVTAGFTQAQVTFSGYIEDLPAAP